MRARDSVIGAASVIDAACRGAWPSWPGRSSHARSSRVHDVVAHGATIPSRPWQRAVQLRSRRRSAPSASSSPSRSACTARRFWAVLPLGVPFVVVDIAGVGRSVNVQTLLLWAFAPLFCAAYVRASQLVTGGAPSLSRARRSPVVVFLPFPILLRAVHPARESRGSACSAWRCPRRWARGSAFARPSARCALGRADLVHAIGGIAALALVVRRQPRLPPRPPAHAGKPDAGGRRSCSPTSSSRRSSSSARRSCIWIRPPA